MSVFLLLLLVVLLIAVWLVRVRRQWQLSECAKHVRGWELLGTTILILLLAMIVDWMSRLAAEWILFFWRLEEQRELVQGNWSLSVRHKIPHRLMIHYGHVR